MADKKKSYTVTLTEGEFEYLKYLVSSTYDGPKPYYDANSRDYLEYTIDRKLQESKPVVE